MGRAYIEIVFKIRARGYFRGNTVVQRNSSAALVCAAFFSSVLLLQNSSIWLLDSSDIFLRRLECIVDIGAGFLVVYPIRPSDSIYFLYSSLSSLLSQFLLKFVVSKRHERFV